jgi:4-hydroxy-4-methyl-2-oxoglutarate aldolase
MTAPDFLLRLRRLDVCAVSDALDALGLPSAVSGHVRRSGGGVLAGRVSTVTLAAGKAPADAPKVHLCTRAVDTGGPGTVIVVSHPGIDAGGWGGVLSNAARRRGIEGVIVDGPSRDIDEAAALAFPVFSRSTTARTARGRVYETATGAPITVADVRVEPSDYVIADGSGIAFVAVSKIEQVLATAERIAARERLMTDAVRSGKPVADVMGADYETMLEKRP